MAAAHAERLLGDRSGGPCAEGAGSEGWAGRRPSGDSLEPAAVTIKGLTAEAKGRLILKDLNATVPAGALCAVMGASGSGKTSLIKALAGVPSGLSVDGQVVMSQAVGSRAGAVGYLPQTEDLLPALTVRETLTFSAALRRVPASAAAVDALLGDLGLWACADTRIGAASGSGISGGERRRVSLAVRLMQRLALFCADEPTSGLDSRSACLAVELLKREASRGCTVLCSIHQPRPELYELFSHLLLLSDGHLVYSGPTADAAQHVQDCTGLRCPVAANPADFLIDVSSLDRTSPERLLESSRRVEQLVARWEDLQEEERVLAEPDGTVAGVDLLRRRAKGADRPGAWRCGAVLAEVSVLTRRAFLCARRDRLLALAVGMQNLMFGLVFGLMDWQLSTTTLPELHSRIALVYITPALSGFFVVSATNHVLREQIAIFDNEHHRDRLYSPLALVLSQFVAALPLNVIAPMPMFCMVYFMANLRLDTLVAPVIFYSLLVIVRMHSTAMALLVTLVVPTRNYALSNVVANAFFLLCIFTGGFLQPVASLPRGIAWARWFAYTFYSFRWNASAQFSGFRLDLGIPGDIILEQLGIEADDYLVPPLCILGLTLLWLTLAVIVLWALPPRQARRKAAAADAMGIATQGALEETPADSTRGRDGPTDLEDQSPRAAAGVSVVLDRVSLELVQSRWPGRARSGDGQARKRILDGVSTGFAPGRLTAIIGPSGAGKTTLLSVLAGRVGSGRAELGGAVLLAGRPASQADLQRCVAVVGQEDHHLPGLTVQETLRFYARLRLPQCSPEQRWRRVRSLVNALGLSGCLSTRVGTPATGGISGGERRRLSVLMACLGDPAVLLLDEPTTGLDALAAQQLVHLLARLASERRQTLACTVHQPRADLLVSFGSLLLLGPGGRVLLDGTQEDFGERLRASGVPLPLKANVADFAMDLIADVKVAASLHERWAAGAAEQVAKLTRQAEAEAGAPRTSSQRCPWHTAFRVLLSRSLLNFIRQLAMIWARCAQVMLYAIVLVPIYSPLGRSQASITSRIGLLYQSIGVLFAGTLNNLAVFPIERDVLMRESADGLYSVGPFFATYSLFEMALEALSTLIAGVTIVQATGLLGGAAPQMVFVAVMFASLVNGESIGIMLNSVVIHPGFSVSMINGLCAVLQIIAGFMANSLPSPLVAINHVSPQMYACRALALSQFTEEETFDCDGPSPVCLRNGSQVLAMLGLTDVGSVASNLIALACCCIAYRTLSFLVLRYRVRRQCRL